MNKLPIRATSPKLNYLKTIPIVLGVSCTATSTQTPSAHIHDCTEIWYSLTGEATHIVGEDVYMQTAGTCVVVPSFVPHVIKITKSDDTPIFVCINVSDKALRALGYDYFSYFDKKIYFDGKILPRFHKFSGDDLLYANDIIRKLSAGFSTLPKASFDTLLSLYIDFIRLLGGEESSPAPSRTLLDKTNSILNATAYLQKNSGRKITIKELCTLTNMSQSKFCEYFTRITGFSTMNYLKLLRMTQAFTAFMTRGKSLSEIAKMIGASDTPHLCRMIKRHYGKTPSELKKLYQVEQQLHDLESRDRYSNLNFLNDYFSKSHEVD